MWANSFLLQYYNNFAFWTDISLYTHLDFLKISH